LAQEKPIGDTMTFTPHLTRKLYKTTLSKEEIVHPILLPAPDGAGKDQDYVRALEWHYIDDAVYATMWDDYATAFNAKNDDKFTVASTSDATKVRALYDPMIKEMVNHAVNNKYNSADLVDASDDVKADIVAMKKELTDKYDAMVLLK